MTVSVIVLFVSVFVLFASVTVEVVLVCLLLTPWWSVHHTGKEEEKECQ